MSYIKLEDYENLENFRKAIEGYVTANLKTPDSGIEELCHQDFIPVKGDEKIYVTLAPHATHLVDYRTGIPILEKNIEETYNNIQNNERYGKEEEKEKEKETILKKYIHSLITQIKEENFKDTYFDTEVIDNLNILNTVEEGQREKYKKEILGIINKLKGNNDPNDEIRFNLTRLALLMKIAENEKIRDLLKEEFEGKTLENTLTEAVEEVIGYIYKLSYRSLVARPKNLTEVFYTSGGKVSYRRDVTLDTNKIFLQDIYTRSDYSDNIVTTSIIKHLFEIFKKYNTSKNKDYKKTESFDKEMVESMISHCSRPLTSSEIEPFFRGVGDRYYNSTMFIFREKKFKIKNPVTRSIVSHANLGKDACVFVLKELNSVKNIDQADMDLLFENEKVRETGVLYEAVKQILEKEKSTEFKQNPELLQSIITHINIFDEEKTEEIRKLIEGLIPNLVDTSVNPNLIALLIKNTDLTSLENTNKAKEVFKKIAKLDQNEFSNNFPKIKQPITIILKSFTEKFDDKNIETILLEDPSILCDAIKNKNIEIVKYCLEHKIFKPFFIKDENTKNTPIRLIESTPGEIFNKMKSLIKEKKHKTGLDDCKKQMEEEANKTKQPKPEQQPEQPKPEQQKPEQPKPEQPKPEQPKPEQPETKKEEKKEQDITLNKEDMDRAAQEMLATQEAKNVLEKLNKSNTGKIEEDVEEYKKIFYYLVLEYTYEMFVKTIMLTKVLEILVEKINDAQKIMLFSILACTIPEKLPEVKGIFEREAGPELISVLKKISSKAENLCHLFKANSDMPYHKRAQTAIEV